MQRSTRLGSGNPFQPGNALKNKNFDKIFFRYVSIAMVLTVLFALLAFLLTRQAHKKHRSVASAIRMRMPPMLERLIDA